MRVVRYDPETWEPTYRLTLGAPGRSLAFEMAESGDERARSTLQSIIARDEDPAKRARASEMLERLGEAV